MKGVILVFFLVAECKFLIEYTKKVETVHQDYMCSQFDRNCEKTFYQKTEHHVAESFKDAKRWINLSGRYETVRHSFYGQQQVDPIEGFQFIALYNCSVPIPLLKKQIGLEKKIVQIKEEQQVPVYEYVSE
ncbi:MAG: hypothetical protein K2Q45_09005 [Nitrosomonas sp.]|nr:hypothetical protein [Nitrosomonas sp.]